jgi:hypothetical protein
MTRFALLATAALLLQDDRAARLERAVGWLANADPEVREMGRQQLAAYGKEALPLLEKRLGEAGLLDLARAWRGLAGAPSAPAWIPEEKLEELPADDPGAKEAAKLDRAFVDRYVRAKYQEAMGFVRKKSYLRAYELAGALLALEPRSAHAEAIRKLRRHADAMVLQTTLLEAKLLHAKPAYAAGEPVELRLRMRNIHQFDLKVSFGKAEEGAKPTAGVVVVEIETRITGLRGETESWTRSQEVRIENEIPVAPGAQWETSFTVDLSTDAADRENVREVTVNAWTAPTGITVKERDATRRIQFEPAVFRVVPERYARFLASPLESLGKTIDTGTAQDTYVCSRLLEGADKDPGAAMLVQAMSKTENAGYREALSWILMHLTGERFGPDPQKWQDFVEKKRSGKK